jgi:hypothetical protein
MKSVLRWHVLYDLTVRIVDELDVDVDFEEERDEVGYFVISLSNRPFGF